MTRMTFTRWEDPVVEQHGQPGLSKYVERYWLPVIGPTAMCIYRRILTDMYPQGDLIVWYDMDVLAASMGLSMTKGEHSPFMRALNRLAFFKLANPTSEYSWSIRTVVPTVPFRQVQRWPQQMQVDHAGVVAALYQNGSCATTASR